MDEPLNWTGNKPMIMRISFISFSILLFAWGCGSRTHPDITPCEVVPNSEQVNYQQMEMVGFIQDWRYRSR